MSNEPLELRFAVDTLCSGVLEEMVHLGRLVLQSRCMFPLSPERVPASLFSMLLFPVASSLLQRQLVDHPDGSTSGPGYCRGDSILLKKFPPARTKGYVYLVLTYEMREKVLPETAV